jgi:hypothetical protein
MHLFVLAWKLPFIDLFSISLTEKMENSFHMNSRQSKSMIVVSNPYFSFPLTMEIDWYFPTKTKTKTKKLLIFLPQLCYMYHASICSGLEMTVH